VLGAAAVGLMLAVGASAAVLGDGHGAGGGDDGFRPGNLVVSRSVYDNSPANVQVGETLPPGCTSGCGAARADGPYPFVFNNDLADASFGITSKVFLDQLTPTGTVVGSLEVPNNMRLRTRPPKHLMLRCFSCYSVLALDLSMSGRELTFIG
jgi:hypothetical protein